MRYVCYENMFIKLHYEELKWNCTALKERECQMSGCCVSGMFGKSWMKTWKNLGGEFEELWINCLEIEGLEALTCFYFDARAWYFIDSREPQLVKLKCQLCCLLCAALWSFDLCHLRKIYLYGWLFITDKQYDFVFQRACWLATGEVQTSVSSLMSDFRVQ